MSQFAELLAQLQAEQEQSEAMAKSVPAEGGKDDDAIQAAAAEAGDTDADDNLEDDDDALQPSPFWPTMARNTSTPPRC